MDITLRKMVGEQLQESENIYRAIFETTGTATIIIEADKMISLLNSEFEKMTGYKRAEWEGKKKWTQYVASKDLSRMKKYHSLRRKDPAAAPRNYEHDLIDNEGRIRHMFLTVDMIPGTKKSVASFTDITEWKEAERGLKKREKELRIKSRSLGELNTTLRVLLKEREGDREELEDKVLSNVRAFVLPYVDKLRRNRLDTKATAYVDIMESNLMDIISPFSRKISSKYRNLTPKEIQLANFIKEGKTSKEIADFLNVSKSAVDINRYRLRNKLGLNKVKANLRSHLVTLA
jgi:PAS domain S-box-containing protein